MSRHHYTLLGRPICIVREFVTVLFLIQNCIFCQTHILLLESARNTRVFPPCFDSKLSGRKHLIAA